MNPVYYFILFSFNDTTLQATKKIPKQSELKLKFETLLQKNDKASTSSFINII